MPSLSIWFWVFSIPIVVNTTSDTRKTVFQCDQTFNASEPFRRIEFPVVPRHLIREGNASSNEQPYNLQCLYTFVAGPGQRVKLEFDHFLLAGSSESCDIEYIDIYSEIESLDDDLLDSALGGRYCGSVAPHVRISLHRIMKIVLHSRALQRHDYGFTARYSYIPEDDFVPGEALPGTKCSYILYSSSQQSGAIFSPTYPGTYPHNMHCSYLLRGSSGERIRLSFRDFDIFFGGEQLRDFTI
ncbi:unnamed protein product [Caenorhabditis auriculariae]|uniref:CUB domain-containing protein n=1 Tax=Caenorhabditis auriculariae TaxID=2777116 RepID=A0A8S1GNY0_9PELO|nr:unnamed protein product [Caenorhabditis auriculariae]